MGRGGRHYWGIFPEGDVRLRPFHNQESVVIGINSVLTDAEEPHGQPLDDKIDPLSLSPESPLYTLASFPLIRRLFSIGRLGLNRGAPFINWPSRGQHAFQVGLEGLKFAVKNGWPRPEQLRAFIAGLTHDPHPGFGDAAKIALGIKEADIVGEYFQGNHQEFWGRWLREIDKQFGIKFTYQDTKDLIERVVRREEKSLAGVIAHGPKKDRLDFDFWAYTVEDASAAVQLIKVPDARYDLVPYQLSDDPKLFAESLARLRDGMLRFDEVEDAGRLRNQPWIYFHEIDIRPYLKIVDGQLVVTNPRAFHRVAQLAAVLYEGHYFHPNTLGPEFMFAQEFNREPERYPSLSDFTVLTDSQLIKRFIGTPAGKWLKGENHYGWRLIFNHLGKSENLSEIAVKARYPAVNLRLSTPVVGQDERIGPWKDLFPNEAEPLLELERRSGQEITLVKDD